VVKVVDHDNGSSTSPMCRDGAPERAIWPRGASI
jgi:hypothetical protein